MKLKHPRGVKRFLDWWYGITSFAVAPLACGHFWGNAGAAFGMLGALFVNGFLVCLFEYWYPPTIR